jgi:hypothetical protein
MRTTLRARISVAIIGALAGWDLGPAAAQVPAKAPPPGTGAPARAPAPRPATSASTPAAPAARVAAAPHATLLHLPAASAPSGTAIELVAVVDAAWAEPELVVRYRSMAGGDWREAAFDRSSAGGWYATIPADAVTPPGAEYYIVGRGPAGEAAHFASAEAPQAIRVEPTVRDRLADIDRRRTGGRTDTVSFDLDGHNFGNRYGISDWFVRGELRWTHRVSTALHSIGFGFGTIQGRTPAGEGADADDVVGASRYGAAELRLRPHPSFFVDARMMLGVSRTGFLGGVSGAVTFGKPWRSHLRFGAEYLDELGASAHVRLQWDTATPLLMGAAIVRSDLPGAIVDSAGLYLRYDLGYRVNPAFAVRGAISYGARDGAAHVGGGFGVETSF